MGNVRIRQATEADVTAIARLQRQWADEGIAYGFVADDAESIRAALGPYYLVAESEGEVIGFGNGTVRRSRDMAVMPDDEAYLEIENVYIVPEHRGRGAGSLLVEALLARAAQDGIRRSLIYSATKDVRSVLRFYERHGFQSWFIQMVR